MMLSAWVGADFSNAVSVIDEASVSEAREHTRTVGRRCGLEGERLERLVTAASELGTNQLRHAKGGVIFARPCSRDGVPGVELIAADRGAGLSDPTRAFQGGFAKFTGSLGVGVSSVRRLADELDVDVRREHGTCFWVRKFASPVARRAEVGIWSTPKVGENVIGDDALFVRSDDGVTALVADGLGHGPQAREASETIAQTIRSLANGDMRVALSEANAAARETRGAALSLVRLRETLHDAACISVGNVATIVYLPDGKSTHFGGTSSTVGGKRGLDRPFNVEEKAFPRGALLLAYSDGVSHTATVDVAIRVEHPIVIAHTVATTYGRGNDDVTVLVVR